MSKDYSRIINLAGSVLNVAVESSSALDTLCIAFGPLYRQKSEEILFKLFGSDVHKISNSFQAAAFYYVAHSKTNPVEKNKVIDIADIDSTSFHKAFAVIKSKIEPSQGKNNAEGSKESGTPSANTSTVREKSRFVSLTEYLKHSSVDRPDLQSSNESSMTNDNCGSLPNPASNSRPLPGKLTKSTRSIKIDSNGEEGSLLATEDVLSSLRLKRKIAQSMTNSMSTISNNDRLTEKDPGSTPTKDLYMEWKEKTLKMKRIQS